MSITIDRGVAIAETRGRHSKYPFGDMAVGDSFALPLAGVAYSPKDRTDRTQRQLQCAAAMWKRKHGTVFTVRILRKESAVRCWRVS